MEREFQRPVLKPGYVLDQIIGIDDPAIRYAVAHDSAWALLNHVTSVADPEVVQRVIHIAETEGIDDIAVLWSASHPLSLAGLLWRLYLLHGVVAANPELARDLFDNGLMQSDTIDPIVAGARTPISPESVKEMCAEILRGAFTGDFADALERAASASAVFSTGAVQLADTREIIDEAHGTQLTRQAFRFDEMHEEFTAGAQAWRAGAVN